MKISDRIVQEYLININNLEHYLATYDNEKHVEITNIVLKKVLAKGIPISGASNRKKFGSLVSPENVQFGEVFHDLYIKDLNSKKNSYRWISKEEYEKLRRKK